MLNASQVWENAVKCWLRHSETGDVIWWERAMGLFATYNRLEGIKC